MELSPGQRKAAFAVIVLALAGLGAFLVFSRVTGAPASHRTGRVTAATSSPLPASQAPAATPAAPPPASGADIYRLLPFTQDDLAQAVGVVQKFAAAYGTYSYQQSAASYAATLRGLATSELTATLARSYATPGVARLRAQQKQVSVGRGTVTALRAFGPSSLTFLVTVVQDISQRQGRSQQASQYAVTVTGGTGHWQVNDIQLASAGNS